MKLPRRKFLQFAGAAVAVPTFPRIVEAQAYPSRPITMIVPFPAGGPADVPARVLAERMRNSLGQSIIIDNVGGAEGRIGTVRAARSRPDGYTVSVGNVSTHALNGAFYSLQYDVSNDFVPILPLVVTPLVLFAKKTMPADDLRQLIDWLKANPGKSSAGFGTVAFQVVNVFFQKETGTRFALIPYRGSAPGMQDLVAGQIDLYFTTPVELPLVRAGSIKAYAVTSDARLAQAPDIPTFAEMGLPSLSFSNWYGLFAPKGTPMDIIGRLNAAAAEALGDKAVQLRLAELGFEIFPRERQTPEALAALMKADADKWSPIIKGSGIKAE
jgi:tripartite-type tricarboxylate transporter receptor subunit TctC